MAINIKALLEKAIFEATVNEDDDYFITLQDTKNKKNWLQLTGTEINASYPYTEHPDEKLKTLEIPGYPGQVISLWEPELFFTYEHDGTMPDQVVLFVQTYLEKVMGYTDEGKNWEVSYE